MVHEISSARSICVNFGVLLDERGCRNVGIFEIAIHLISMGYPYRNYATDSG